MQLLKTYSLLTIATVLLLLLLLFPPIYLYEFYPYGVSGYVGLVLGYIIPAGIKRVFYSVNKKKKQVRRSYSPLFVIIVILSMLIMCLFTALWCDYSTYTLFRTKGILVKDALIINGKQKEEPSGGGTSDNYEIELSYKLKNGTVHHTITPVEADIFEHVYKEQKVDILYLPNNLDIVRVLTRDNVNLYLKRSNRQIEATDIESIFNCNDAGLLTLLNGIGYRWHTESEDGQIVYSNHLTLEKVAKIGDQVAYTCLGEEYAWEYLKPLKIEGKPIDLENHSELYLTKKYKVIVKRILEDGATFNLFIFVKRTDYSDQNLMRI